MTNPRVNAELPELPLNQPLRQHITDYLLKLCLAMDLYDKVPVDMSVQKELLSVVYEQLSDIMEFADRERELMNGDVLVGSQLNLAHDRAYIIAVRDGETILEVPMNRTEFTNFIAGCIEFHELMSDSGDDDE